MSAYIHNGDIGSPEKIKCELVKKLVELAIVFINELQIKSPGNLELIRRYVEIQEKVLNKVYGL